MDLRVQAASVADFPVAGGGNGVVVTRLAWNKVPRIQRRSRPRGHGSVDLSRYYDGRLYELAGLIKGLGEEDAQARLDSLEQAIALSGDSFRLEWLLAGRTEAEWASVRVDDDLDYEFTAESRSVIRWALTLFAEDPRRYGTTVRIGSYDPTTANTGSGVDFALAFALTFAGEATTNLAVTNAGNFSTPPVFTITGPATNPIIDNETTGESIVTTGLALLAGETCVIDVANKALTLGGASRPDLIDASGTTWFDLVPGENLLRLRGPNMLAGSTELAVSFYDARI